MQVCMFFIQFYFTLKKTFFYYRQVYLGRIFHQLVTLVKIKFIQNFLYLSDLVLYCGNYLVCDEVFLLLLLLLCFNKIYASGTFAEYILFKKFVFFLEYIMPKYIQLHTVSVMFNQLRMPNLQRCVSKEFVKNLKRNVVNFLFSV